MKGKKVEAPATSFNPSQHLGLSVEDARRLGWIAPSNETVVGAAAKLAGAIRFMPQKSGEDLYLALSGHGVWAQPEVKDLVKAVYQAEISIGDSRLAAADPRLDEMLKHMLLSVPGTELPFIRPGLETKPYRQGQEVLLPKDVPSVLAEEAIQGERVVDFVPKDQLTDAMKLFYAGELRAEGPQGAYTGTYVAANYLGNLPNVSLPRWVDPAVDGTVLTQNIPTRFDWAVGKQPNSMEPDEFFKNLWDSTPKSRQAQINWLLDEALSRAPASWRKVLDSTGAGREDLKRSLLLAFHHVKDIQFSMATFGYPEWRVGHDWMEITSVDAMRNRAVWESDRPVIEWIDKLEPGTFPNAGIANPAFILSYALWSLGLRDHSGQGSMQIHRAVPHHTSAPDAPAEMVERGTNGQIHHTRVQGPWGVRGETAVPFSGWKENLEHVFKEDNAFRSTVLLPLGRDALALNTELSLDGKQTPIHLLKTVELPWNELHGVEKRTEAPWGKAIREELLQKGAGKTWWNLAQGDRVPLLHLGANIVPWFGKFGADKPVTQGMEVPDGVAALKEAKASVGDVKELKMVAQALFATYGELALSEPPNAAKHKKRMVEVAKVMGITPRDMLTALGESLPAAAAARAGLEQLCPLVEG